MTEGTTDRAADPGEELDQDEGEQRPERARRSRRAGATRRPWRAAVGVAVAVVGVVVVALVVWGALAALSLQRSAGAASDDVGQVRRALADGDVGGALSGTRAAARQAGRARSAAGALPIVLAGHLPGRLGASARAVRAVTDATDTALGSGALPLLRVASDVQGGQHLVRADGSIDTDRLVAQDSQVVPAVAALARAREEVGSVDPAPLPRAVRTRVAAVRTGIDQLSSRAAKAGAALSVLPTVLGVHGPRSYLVVFQNTAEVRPTGGIAGTWALVTVSQGRAQLQQTGSDTDLSTLTGTVPDLGAQFRANYPQDKVSYVQDANLSPHFPYAARIYASLWQQAGHAAPDGVIAVDPTGMAPLLSGAGTITVPGGPSVSSGDIVDVMLRQVYVDFATDNGARKQYLSTVVGETFARALGAGSLRAATLKGLVSAAQGHHVLAWSADAGTERELVRAGIGGSLPRPTRHSAGVFLTNTSGVYLTNTAASKLDYYVHETVTTTGGCAGEPARLRVALRNDAPAQVPDYVANKVAGVSKTTESLFVAFYVPPTRGVASVEVGGQQVPFSTGTERGWSLVRLGVVVPRASTTTVDVVFTGASSPVEHVLTGPMVNSPDITTASACAR